MQEVTLEENAEVINKVKEINEIYNLSDRPEYERLWAISEVEGQSVKSKTYFRCASIKAILKEVMEGC